jgi:hypothetical protein
MDQAFRFAKALSPRAEAKARKPIMPTNGISLPVLGRWPLGVVVAVVSVVLGVGVVLVVSVL